MDICSLVYESQTTPELSLRKKEQQYTKRSTVNQYMVLPVFGGYNKLFWQRKFKKWSFFYSDLRNWSFRWKNRTQSKQMCSNSKKYILPYKHQEVYIRIFQVWKQNLSKNIATWNGPFVLNIYLTKHWFEAVSTLKRGVNNLILNYACFGMCLCFISSFTNKRFWIK